jgi:hypothetical protein
MTSCHVALGALNDVPAGLESRDAACSTYRWKSCSVAINCTFACYSALANNAFGALLFTQGLSTIQTHVYLQI